MNPLVACILPVRGRPEQTVQVARRLIETAGDVAAEWLVASGADDHDVCQEVIIQVGMWLQIGSFGGRLTYWQALDVGTAASNAPILCCLANDLDPAPNWLANGLAAYRARFGEGHGLMGFAGDGHGPQHSCHFLIGRSFLTELGGWPVWYDHNFGDTELCRRAQALARYGKATQAVLAHRHVWAGAPDDAVYQAGRAKWNEDEALYYARLSRGWV